MTDTVTEITGLPIHYFVILDFDGFEKIIDTVGGVRINAERDFLDTRYPGKNYGYETFQLSKGWHSLDGATALKYVRERHADPEGDFGRAKRQQETIRAVRDKVFSVPTFLNPVMISRECGRRRLEERKPAPRIPYRCRRYRRVHPRTADRKLERDPLARRESLRVGYEKSSGRCHRAGTTGAVGHRATGKYG
jgi:hypothetical protein